MTFEPIDTSCIDDESRPWMPFVPYSELVSVKLYRADPVRGEIVVVYRAPPGAQLPCCRQSGTTTIFTVQGRWKYRGLDWVAGPGSVVIDHPASQHTAEVLADGTDDAILFAVTQGDLLMLDDDGRIVGTENWRTAVDRYLEHCRDNGLEPLDVMGLNA